ncbi:hypothetical protein KC19_4G215400 [Ceratodon purpureus]|uniref:Secreted protein n=1 Tax=Ceratodon purpureus TaxID=3225 RepID=A0A8T0IC52_CERPU|nr:hypothetical protein KC19_4G215400 [Ceratodon purpureus]
MCIWLWPLLLFPTGLTTSSVRWLVFRCGGRCLLFRCDKSSYFTSDMIAILDLEPLCIFVLSAVRCLDSVRTMWAP